MVSPILSWRVARRWAYLEMHIAICYLVAASASSPLAEKKICVVFSRGACPPMDGTAHQPSRPQMWRLDARGPAKYPSLRHPRTIR
eukprot:scaffold5863_cov105-Isochrysis_galbana.AAC.4